MERYQYDALNQRIRMDEYTLTGIQKTYTAYAYDNNGNRTMEQNRVPTTPVRNFQSTTNTGTWGGVYKTYTYNALGLRVNGLGIPGGEAHAETSYTETIISGNIYEAWKK